MANLSPMMKQYFDIKKQYPDTILFFRLGDFYEMFYDDAKLASRGGPHSDRARLRAGGTRTHVRCTVPQL